MSLGGLNDAIYIKGSAAQYSNSKPGVIADALYKAGHRKIVILLDEIDKLSKKNTMSDASSALLDALDQDNQFVDTFLDLPINLKDIIFIATANDLSEINSALRDRMYEINIRPYTNGEKFHICKNYIISREREMYDLTKKQLRIKDDVLYRLIEEDNRNSGIRGLTKKIKKICRYASKEISESKIKRFTLTMDKAKEMGIISQLIIKHLLTNEIGKAVTSGVDIINGSEHLLEVDATYVRGTPEPPTVLGSTLDNYSATTNLVWSYFMNNSSLLRINDALLQETKMLVNVERLAMLRFDPNYKLAIFCAMYSALLRIMLPYNHLIIGNVSLLGGVSSNTKSLVHIQNGINKGAKVIIAPFDLEERVSDLNYDQDITFCFIKNVKELGELFTSFFIHQRINSLNQDKKELLSFKELQDEEAAIRLLMKEQNLNFQEAFDQYYGIKDTKQSAEEALHQLIGLSPIKE
ncbi:MAG: AAA family ATPase, partial [Halanaerobiales bacterium]